MLLRLSALNRIANASPTCTIPVGSRSSVRVPVAGTCATILKLAYGVLAFGRPISDSARPAALNGVLDVSTISDDTIVLVETLATDAPITPECTRSFALTRTFATYGEGIAQLDRVNGPENVMEDGL